MWRFFDGLHMDCTKQKTTFLQGVAGANHPAEKRYRILLKKVQRSKIQTYGQTVAVTYLRAIAHLSFS